MGSSETGRGWRSVVGLLSGVLLVGVYVAAVGSGDVRRAVTGLPPRRLASLVVLGTVSAILWGTGLHLLLRRLGAAFRLRTSVLLFTVSTFANGITPFGQVGGDPVTAAVADRSLGVDFETGLATIGSLNALNSVAAVSLGLLGAGYLGSRAAFGRTLEDATLTVVVVSVVVLVGAVAAWRYRRSLGVAVAAALTPLLRVGARPLPGVEPPSHPDIERRVGRFVGALERVASDPTRLAVVFGLSLAGQSAIATTLWMSITALGLDASVAVVLVVIPVAKLAGATPTPGGSGSAEAALTALLVAATDASAAVAAVGALLYRVSAFWLPATVGGVAAAWFSTLGRRDAPPRRDEESNAAVRVTNGGDSSRSFPAVSLIAAVLVALLVVLVVHRSHLLVEPTNLFAHATRDAAVAVTAASLAWFLLRWVAERASGPTEV